MEVPASTADVIFRSPVTRIGVIAPDEAEANNHLSTVRLDATEHTFTGREGYVSVADEDVEFVGRLVGGPFYRSTAPTQGPAASELCVTATVEILGQLTGDERVEPTNTRPRPGAVVRRFPEERLRRLLRIEGDLLLGRLAGTEGLLVHAASTNKNFLPRNVGVFGTVGSGKSNTVQVVAEEALAAGWAVVVVDVEGEYVCMDEPTSDAHAARLLEETFGVAPAGASDFRVYVPASGRSEAVRPSAFKIPVSAMETEVVSDILEFTEAERRFFVTASAQAVRQNAYQKSGAGSSRPFTLQHLVDGLLEGPTVLGQPSVQLVPGLQAHDLPAVSRLRAKLIHLGQSGLLDWNETASVEELPVDELLVGGRLSVLDVSETDDRSRNLAIAYVLRSLFDRVVATARGEVMPNGRVRPPLLVVIEEVHTFVSRAAAPRMRSVLDNLQIISRRGRKRWMALALVSQQPDQVPDELFELANTRFIHQLKSQVNLEPLRQTSGGVDESLWSVVPGMGPGECLLTGAALRNPLFITMRPARSRRLLQA